MILPGVLLRTEWDRASRFLSTCLAQGRYSETDVQLSLPDLHLLYTVCKDMLLFWSVCAYQWQPSFHYFIKFLMCMIFCLSGGLCTTYVPVVLGSQVLDPPEKELQMVLSCCV